MSRQYSRRIRQYKPGDGGDDSELLPLPLRKSSRGQYKRSGSADREDLSGATPTPKKSRRSHQPISATKTMRKSRSRSVSSSSDIVEIGSYPPTEAIGNGNCEDSQDLTPGSSKEAVRDSKVTETNEPNENKEGKEELEAANESESFYDVVGADDNDSEHYWPAIAITSTLDAASQTDTCGDNTGSGSVGNEVPTTSTSTQSTQTEDADFHNQDTQVVDNSESNGKDEDEDDSEEANDDEDEASETSCCIV